MPKLRYIVLLIYLLKLIMRDMQKKANRLVSGVALVALVFSLGGSALTPKPVSAAGEDFQVGFHYDNSFATEGQTSEIELIVEDLGHGAVRGDIEIMYSITNGMNNSGYASSTSVDDFVFNNSTSTSGTITIPASESSVLVPVQDIDDANIENREAFTITLTGALMTGTSTVAVDPGYPYPAHAHIINDNDAATVNLSSEAGYYNFVEGSNSKFKVVLSKAVAQDVTFNWQTNDNTAVYPDDFTIPGGHVTIPAGETSTTVDIGLVDDAIQEGAESFFITLSNPVNAVLGTASSRSYLISDNDITKVGFAVTSTSGLESVGTVPVTMVLNYPSANTVVATIGPVSALGHASTPADFQLSTTTIVFPPNTTSTTFDLIIQDDHLQEGNEPFNLQIIDVTNGGSQIGFGPNTMFGYTIIDDDVATVPTLGFAIQNNSFDETVSGLVTVALEEPLTQDVTFQWKVDGGSASMVPYSVGGVDFPADFTGGSTSYVTSTILAGGTAVVLDLGVVHDNLSEGDETIELSLANVVGAELGARNTFVYTIAANDFPSVQFRATASSGSESTAQPGFAIDLSNPSTAQVNIYIAAKVASSTAEYNTDWTLHGLVASVLIGQTSTTFNLDVVDDAIQESDETAVFYIENADAATVGAQNEYTYTISANDVPVAPPTSGGGGGGGGGSSSGGGSAIPVIPATTGSGVFAGENHSVRVDSVTTVGDMNFANLVIVGGTAVRMAIANNPEFENAVFETYKTSAIWKLASGSGEKTVYVKFFNNAGSASEPVSTTVTVGGSVGQVLGERVSLLDELITRLKFGSTNDEVRQMQIELQSLGFFPANVKTTGYYGLVTKASVAKYLASKYETMTVDELIVLLKYGQRGLAVKRLQDELKKLGFFPAAIASTGLYGPATKASVAKYLASK